MSHITNARTSSLGISNAQYNQQFLREGKSLKLLRNAKLGVDDSAVVIAAGPSMQRTKVAKQLKELKFEGAIISTESALLYCLRNKIIPDLVVSLDPHHSRIVRWFGDPDLTSKDIASDDYFSRQDLDPSFADELKTNQEIIQLVNQYGPKLKIALSTSASPKVVQRVLQAGMDIYWWNPMYDDPDQNNSITKALFLQNKMPCINAGGNVGSACWMMASALLSKKHIALTGMDFGYYSDTPYENTQYYNDAVTLIGIDNMDSFFIKQYNPHLDQWFYTDPAYMWYKNCFLEMVAETHSITYNCTGGGILFGENIRFISLNRFIESRRQTKD